MHFQRKYKAHYMTIQQALKFGCKLLKVHRVISFNQEPFSRDFLQMMTLRRKHAASKFEERMCKGNLFSEGYFISLVFCFSFQFLYTQQ